MSDDLTPEEREFLDEWKAKRWRRRRRVLLIVGGAFLALILLLVISALIYGWYWQGRLNARLAAMRAQGKLLTWQQVLDRDKDLPADQNSALVYLKAFGQLQDTHRAEVMEELHDDFAARPSQPARDLCAAVSKADAQGLATILSAAPLKEGCYPLGQAWDLGDVSLKYCEQTRRAVVLCGRLAESYAAQGRPEEATRYLKACLGMASSFGRKPLMIEELVRIAVDAITVSSLERSLALCEFPASDLSALRMRLQGEAAGHSFEGAVAAESGNVDRVWRQEGRKGAASKDFPRGYFLIPGWRQRDELAYLTVVDEMDRIAALPMRQGWAESQRYRARMAATPEVGLLPAVVAPVLQPTFSRVWRSEAEEQMQLAVASTALAVEQYRMKNGRWPQTLDQLVPEFLDVVPDDCFGAGKLHYLRTDKGVRVYSIGPDGQDEGGATREEAQKADPNAGGDPHDVVFRLLDPKLRGAKTAAFRDEVLGAYLGLDELNAAGFDEEALKRLGLTDDDLNTVQSRQ